MLLEVEALDLRYGATHAVRGVSLSVAEGEIVAVLGANGAGKSSLMRAIAGAAAASGRIRLAGSDISRMPAARRVRAGLVLVPEGRQIFVSMTVEENLLVGAHTRRDRAVARDLAAVLERFPNLAARRGQPAAVLSGGEQQMLAIGRALMARPRLMMLDEPSLGLSPILVAQLFDLIAALNRQGIAILLVEQNTQMALETAARGYVMELGRIRTSGSAAELARDPALADAYLGAAAP
ncbi:MAG: ABC transporter ATP-binding protein [Alphaproteobacteria bacterium]|nr:MAG: ABC transporter ATP-binding protein [Alphaproteobacteria bacterium]